jgi:type IV secretory pathway VirB10-like protein
MAEERARTPSVRSASSVVSPPSKSAQHSAPPPAEERDFDAQMALLSKRSNSDPPRARRAQSPKPKKRRNHAMSIAVLALLGVAAAIGVELSVGEHAWLTSRSEAVTAAADTAKTAPLLAIDRAQVAPNEALAPPPASTEAALTPPASAVEPKVPALQQARSQRAEPEPEPQLEPAEDAQSPPPAAAAFDAEAAERAIDQAAALAQSCKRPDDPEGLAVVIVTFAPSGRATTATVSGEPFAGTATGSCIAAKFRAASVPPYSGDFITVKKSVSVKNATPLKK